MELISPKYQMELTKKVIKAIWDEYTSYKDVDFYISKWQEITYLDDFGHVDENFHVYYNDGNGGKIDLEKTIHHLEGEMLLKFAIDLGLETPDFIPAIPVFRNEIKSSYATASTTFEKAFKQIETHPDIAIGLANSALESIIKEILKDDRINNSINSNKTLYDQTCEILKQFQMFPDFEMPSEIKTIGSSLLAINQSIERLRSEKTMAHGRTNGDYVIEDPMYTYLIINSVATVGLFLSSYYKMKFPKPVGNGETVSDDDLPF